MATTPSSTRSARVRIAGITLATLLLFAIAGTAPAQAATVAANYTQQPLTYYTGAHVQRCGGRSGDADDAGRFYTLCLFLRDVDGNGTGDFTAPALVEYSARGVVQRVGWLPQEYWFGQNAPANYEALDVGVSPDGNTAYVTPGPNIDNLGTSPTTHPYTKQPLPNGASTGVILRLKRGADGSWAHDAGWRAGPFTFGGNAWSARRLAVDAAGRVYVTTNSLVYEISPATGGIVGGFGGGATTNGPGGAWLEGIDNAQGIAVSDDGTTIYVVEQQHHIVQRWVRVGATDWARDTSFLLGRPSEEGDALCDSDAHFQSPYDVGVDDAGDVYVLDTTCNRVQRFTKAGAFVQTVWESRTADTLELSHGFAVNGQGSVVLPTETSMLARLDPPVRPAPAPAPTPAPAPKPNCVDRTSPRIVAPGVPRRTKARRITVKPTTSDDCGITHVRVLGNRMGRPRWVAGTETAVAVSGWNGRRTIFVQVRDTAGRIATRRAVLVLALPQPALRARARVNLAGRGCRAGNPMRRIAGASGYRLVDRCARLTGRVLRASQRGRTVTAELLLPTVVARAIYENAVGPVKILVISDSRTRIARPVRTRRSLTVVGSLIATQGLTATYAIPVDVLAGS